MAFVIIVRAFIDVYERSIFVVESSFLHDCCDHSERSSDMETSFELVLKSISAIAVALTASLRLLKSPLESLAVEWEFTVSIPGASKIIVSVSKITEKYRYCFCPANVQTFNRVARMTTSKSAVSSFKQLHVKYIDTQESKVRCSFVIAVTTRVIFQWLQRPWLFYGN